MRWPCLFYMFISPIIIQHGIIALEKEIAHFEKLHKAYGNEWPPDFDPNDIWIYDSRTLAIPPE